MILTTENYRSYKDEFFMQVINSNTNMIKHITYMYCLWDKGLFEEFEADYLPDLLKKKIIFQADLLTLYSDNITTKGKKYVINNVSYDKIKQLKNGVFIATIKDKKQHDFYSNKFELIDSFVGILLQDTYIEDLNYVCYFFVNNIMLISSSNNVTLIDDMKINKFIINKKVDIYPNVLFLSDKNELINISTNGVLTFSNIIEYESLKDSIVITKDNGEQCFGFFENGILNILYDFGQYQYTKIKPLDFGDFGFIIQNNKGNKYLLCVYWGKTISNSHTIISINADFSGFKRIGANNGYAFVIFNSKTFSIYNRSGKELYKDIKIIEGVKDISYISRYDELEPQGNYYIINENLLLDTNIENFSDFDYADVKYRPIIFFCLSSDYISYQSKELGGKRRIVNLKNNVTVDISDLTEVKDDLDLSYGTNYNKHGFLLGSADKTHLYKMINDKLVRFTEKPYKNITFFADMIFLFDSPKRNHFIDFDNNVITSDEVYKRLQNQPYHELFVDDEDVDHDE